MKWYQAKEQAAGEKRLYITWLIYKMLGRKAVRIVAVIVTFFAFLGAKEARRCSKKYLEIIELKPSLYNQVRHFLEYSFSLVDNMEVFSGNYDTGRIIFNSGQDKIYFDEIISHGAFLIFSHLGNINVLRALVNKYNLPANIFIATEQSKIFNGFMKKIEINVPFTTYPVEKISIETSIEIKDKLARGELVFIAGDRTSKNSTNTEQKLFGQKVQFPAGTFRFAKLMECPVYFICALREGDNSKVYLKKFISDVPKSELADVMQKEFVSFLEKLTPLAPFQFFHFYDLFEN